MGLQFIVIVFHSNSPYSLLFFIILHYYANLHSLTNQKFDSPSVSPLEETSKMLGNCCQQFQGETKIVVNTYRLQRTIGLQLTATELLQQALPIVKYRRAVNHSPKTGLQANEANILQISTCKTAHPISILYEKYASGGSNSHEACCYQSTD